DLHRKSLARPCARAARLGALLRRGTRHVLRQTGSRRDETRLGRIHSAIAQRSTEGGRRAMNGWALAAAACIVAAASCTSAGDGGPMSPTTSRPVTLAPPTRLSAGG